MKSMKKMMVVATMMLAATVTANAQARFDEGTVTLQPRIGLTGSMFTNMPPHMNYYGMELDAKPTGGGMFGLDVEYYLTERVSLTGGLAVMQAGTGWKNFEYVDGSVRAHMKNLKIETAYLSVPVMACWYVAPGLALKAGVQAGFLTRGKVKGTITSTDGSLVTQTDMNEDCKDELQKFDLSVPVGLSYEFSTPLVIDARWNVGLTKVNKESDPDEKDSRNMVFSLSLGYKFSL